MHERDIDTDFILLAMKRIIRNHPKVRLILMSATIDNRLFQYYFAKDEVDTFMERENYYKKYTCHDQYGINFYNKVCVFISCMNYSNLMSQWRY